MIAHAVLILLTFLSLPSISMAMGQFSDSVRDQRGRAIPNMTVTVYDAGTLTLSTIYSDNGVTPKGNPFTAGIFTGDVNFYAANGKYDIVYSAPGATFDNNRNKSLTLLDGFGPIRLLTAFPTSLATGDIVIITDDSSSGACLSDGGSFTSLCMWDGENWISIGGSGGGGGGVTGWPSNTTTKEITTANSRANAICIGDGSNPICIYTDPTLGGVIRPETDTNTRTHIWDNFTYGWRDNEGDADMFIVDPDATDNLKYTWQSGYRPVKSIPFPADSLYPLGSSSVITNTALISGGHVSPYVTVTDSDSDGFYRYLRMPDNWDGSPVGATVAVVNVNATPANDFVVHVSGACYAAGTVIPTTISTTNEQAITISFGASGSCGASACNQNDEAHASAGTGITVNGEPAGGNWCGFQAQVDATGTTETVAGLKIVQFDISYRIERGF